MPNRIQFTPAPENTEAAEAALWDLGALAITLRDAGDQPLHEPGPGETPMWDRSIIEALVPEDLEAQHALLALSAAGVIAAPAEVRFEQLADRDWERAWMDRFEPMCFGKSTWICPWHIEPEPEWPVVVRLDPGLAFGTGTHPTTALCLEWMDGEWMAGDRENGTDFNGATVIDYGCGSGVLAVAAALMGARNVLAVDHDPQALTATRENAERNGVGGRIETALPDEFDEARADLVLANILAGPLIELSEKLSGMVRPGGWLLLSGILAEQRAQVVAAYSEHIGHIATRERDGWIRLDFKNDQ